MRGLTCVRLTVAASLLLLSAILVGVEARVKEETMNPYYEGFYLTRIDEAYRIEREPNPESVDGPQYTRPPPACNLQQQPCFAQTAIANAINDHVVGDYSGLPVGPTTIFQGAPLGRDLALNTSRHLRLDLFYSHATGGDSCGNPNHWLEVRLYVGSRYLAGQAPNSDGGYNTNTKVSWIPEDPETQRRIERGVAGWCPLRLRLHPELDLVPGGEPWTLVIQLSADAPSTKLGFSGDHVSTLFVPTFAPEEFALRRPDLVSGGRPVAPIDTSSGAEEGVEPSFAAAIGVLAFFPRRRRRSAILLGVAFLSIAFSGCAGPNYEASTDDGFGGTASVSVVPGTGIPSRASSIVGTVRDAEGIAVVGARVYVQEQDRSALTGPFGQFSLTELAPGLVTVRVEKAGFRVFAESLDLSAGTTLQMNVQLQRVDEKAGARFHAHDHWGPGTTSRVAFDEKIPSTPICSTGCSMTFFSLSPWDPQGRPFNTILPGTREIEVVLTWDPTVTNSHLRWIGLAYRSPDDADKYAWNLTLLAPRPAGVAFRIQTSWEMTDSGHQRFSEWKFAIWAPQNQTRASTLDNSAAGPNYQKSWGPIHMKMTLHKGTVPLERPHEDPWKGRPTIQVADTEIRTPACKDSCETNVNMSVRAVSRIPPETERLYVSIEARRAVNPDFGWRLAYKGARSTQGNNCAANAVVEGFTQAPAPERSGLVWTWNLTVDGADADPFYGKAPNWCFWIQPDNLDNYRLDYCATSGWCTNTLADGSTVTNTRRPLYLAVNVTAIRGAD